MKKKILYKGNEGESLWAAIGYIGPMFLLSEKIDKNSIFLKAHAIRSFLILLIGILINIPCILIHFFDIRLFICDLYLLFGFISSSILIIIYCKSVHQAANGIYKKTLIDKIFGKYISKYLIDKFHKKEA